MPKTKTKSGAKKRFSVTGSGKVKREKPYHGHILTSKTQKRKRSLRQSTLVADTESKTVKRMLGM
ncbi:MAG: 50S ribosomal protein L35 [bacterium]